ncbi:MAG: ISAs1 family transposase [Candidatus Promineifilaceae bacterium]
MLAEHFSEVTDPRLAHLVEHKLEDIIVLVVCATICGADGWEEIAEWGKEKKKWLSERLGIKKIPSGATMRRVFIVIDPEEFQTGFQKWVGSVFTVTKGQVIAIDGKQMRGSAGAGRKALCMVSAWATANQIVLGQRQAEEKSNEITAIPELLKLLNVSGCLVTIDAAGCQVENAQLIRKQDGDYLLALKGNQGTMFEDVQTAFACAERLDFVGIDGDYAETHDEAHGRHEIRKCWAIDDETQLRLLRNRDKWYGLRTIVMIETHRTLKGKTAIERRYFISSLACNALKILNTKRMHWQVENSLHWCLDVAFSEDSQRSAGNAAANLAVVRHIALSLLKQDSSKGSIKRKRKRAGWNHNFLEQLLQPN